MDIMARRWSKVLSITEINKVDILILGVWGCDAFKCSSTVVSEVFNKASKTTKFSGNIIFAIPAGVNFNVFKENIEI